MSRRPHVTLSCTHCQQPVGTEGVLTVALARDPDTGRLTAQAIRECRACAAAQSQKERG